MHTDTIIGIIPARYASTRFPGKPLADMGGKTMIRRVFEAASEVLSHVCVATDNDRIFNEVQSFGGEALMTSQTHPSGTDRCAEALAHLERRGLTKFNVVINIQGDEPFIRSDQLIAICDAFEDSKVDIATLVKPVQEHAVVFDPNRPKVVLDQNDFALYFSRSAIPFLRDVANAYWHKKHTYFQHIGLYAYRADILKKITKLPPGRLESAESLEQLRWLENGMRIKAIRTQFESYGIDTPEDLQKVLKLGLLKN